ncbi:type VI secretion system baseplate subunit TssE [Salmonella enterica]
MSTSRFTPANHLLPTLFDRLCDNAPYQKIDRDISVTPVQLKEIIRRDLSFLLNTISHEGDIDARRYPLAGSFMYEHKWDDISEAIRRAIIRFEPRLNAATLRVTPLLDKTRQGSYNTLQFEIRGQILTQPYPTEFLVRSALDMELSRITFF